MRILTNLPLECLDERAALRDVELVTYGPAWGLQLDGVHVPFDVAFDPSTGSWDELAACLPPGFAPDLLLVWRPDQEPLPAGMEHCPVPVVGVLGDYDLTLPYLAGLWPFFDLLLCDRAGQDLFARLAFANVRYWCQHAPQRHHHRRWPDAGPRDLDVGFAGDLDTTLPRHQAPWLHRVQQLAGRGVRAEVRAGMRGADQGRFLNRCRVGWNRSRRGEMNQRAFAIPACGAVLLLERENLEVADFFVPGEQCVLYGADDFEAVVDELLGDRARCARIAAAGHRRVQDHRLGNRLHELHELARGITRHRPRSSEAERVLARAIAMLPTWAEGATIAAAALAAHDLAPDDPRTLNLLGLATLRWRGAEGGDAAWRLWQRALQIAPDYVPAAANLAALATAADDADLQRTARELLVARRHAATWAAVDGPTLPFGSAEVAIDRSLALQAAVREGRPAILASELVR